MATYGKLRSTTISGQAGTTWYVQLWKKDYTGSSSDMALNGEGFSVNWSGQGGTRDRQFVNSECVLNMYAQNDTDEDLIYDIFSKGDRSYYVRIYKNGEATANIWWFGWVNPSFSKIENVSFPYRVNIKATDSIGIFSKRSDDVLSNVNYGLIERVNTHIKDFGDTMGLYNSETELVVDGNFPDPSPDWDIQPTWTIPSGGGQIDYDGTSTKYIRQDLNSSVVAGDDYTISFTILNLADGESAKLRLLNYNGQYFFNSNLLTYTSNGNYQVSGTLLYSSSGLNITGYFGDSFSLTDVSVIEGLISNPSPCPTNNNWFQTSIDWWRDGDDYESDDPFYLYRASKSAYIKKPDESPQKYKEYDVLKGVLKTFNTACILSDGKYNFIQPNNWLGNTNGELPFYRYSVGGNNRDTSTTIETNLLSINGNTTSGNGAILAGSNITFEPAFKEVTINHKITSDLVRLIQNVNVNTYLNLGYIDASAGEIEFKLSGINIETYLTQVIASNLPSGFEVPNWGIQTEVVIDISITNGVNTYYLNWDGTSTNSDTSIGNWSTTNVTSKAVSGYAYPDSEAGANPINDPTVSYPTRATRVGAYYEMVSSFIQTVRASSAPPISGVLSIRMNAINFIRRYNESTGAVFFMPLMSIESRKTVLSADSHIRSVGVFEDEEGINEITFTSSQNVNTAEESFNLGDVIVGSPIPGDNDVLNQFNIAHTLDGEVRYITNGFRRGNSGDYLSTTQLLTDDFLQLQIEPLEILQANIYSSDISPSKLLKYSINGDNSYNYYTFLGGKFSAQSETMSGEWYKVNSSNSTIIIDPEFINLNGSNLPNQTQFLLSNFKSESRTGLIEASLGILSVAISSGVATTLITLGSSLKGDIVQNQNLKLTMPNGTKAKTIVVLTGKNSSANSFNTDSFTTDIDYPIGSIISISPYETVGLMQSLVSSGNVNFRASGSDNIQEINFLPQDFNLTSAPTVGVSSEDLGGSIQIASATSNMYAQKLISKGKTITKVTVFASANFGFRVYEGFIFNDTTTLVGTGVANTELDITDIVGTSRNYITIEIDVDSASEKVYGGFALVTNT